MTTRYHCAPSQWIPAEKIKDDLIPNFLYPLEKSVQKLLADNTDLGKITWK